MTAPTAAELTALVDALEAATQARADAAREFHTAEGCALLSTHAALVDAAADRHGALTDLRTALDRLRTAETPCEHCGVTRLVDEHADCDLALNGPGEVPNPARYEEETRDRQALARDIEAVTQR